MNLDFSPEDVAFRDEVRAFIANDYPADIRAKQDAGTDLDKDDYLAWHRVMAKKGWVAPGWPVEYGGPGLSDVQKYLLAEELAFADTAPILPFGLKMVAPVIYTFGTAEQKTRWLPPTLAGDMWWCQGYSEPGAGSDLASLTTRAVRGTDEGGDHYVVNGQKTWTTLAQYADWGFFLVRTDPTAKPQMGISFLLIDMKSPGVTVRPIITMDGRHEVNEVWLEEVRVPVENRIHNENEGWTCAKFLLAHERTNIANVAGSKRALQKLRNIAEKEGIADDPGFAAKLAELEIDLMALEYTELRSLARQSAGRGPGPESSLLKIKGTEIQQRLSELTLEAVGPYGLPDARGLGNAGPVGPDYAGRAAPTYFNVRKTSIYGGSNEIQRNIIAKLVLGL
ncbi:acyl-CoA dehydrogenase family protein [Brevundimonas sp.]|uniref:acyl-CoA dehydrogenase family protein n=1 Tax=Brevundimonas sp. TaxID=1871086 RepID=UPI00286CA6E5|nr:acyl-CoA dehydrogenase family protein [Brevundimonas sp.]